jgi:hypothetical protein
MRLRLKIKIVRFFCLAALVAGVAAQLHGQATLLLEEPYSYDGTFAGTGHAAVYLSRVCAESPTVLRRCQPGETGVVISRYHNIAGRDWIAVPLITYLYAVDSPEDVPLVADERLVKFLRHNYVESIGVNNAASYQLAGSAYDRTSYGFRVATRPEQDDELIRILNSSPNSESYKLLNRNCADFAKQIINFYYPKAIHRSVVGDLGVMTPKQAAKSLVHSARRHPEMQLTTFIIPQVPGLKRSKPVHGVIESLVLAKKYVTPVLLFHPFVVGAVEAAYWTGWRFDPAKGALIFNPNSDANSDANPYASSDANSDADSWDPSDPRNALELPLSSDQRRTYERALSAAQREGREAELADWRKLQASAEPQLDASGEPFLKTQVEGKTVLVGVSRGDALRLSAPPEFTQQLLLTRLEHELKSGKPARTSQKQVESDWNLLQRATEARQAELAASR